jgi:DNA-binding MarR family transcriptional regulator
MYRGGMDLDRASADLHDFIALVLRDLTHDRDVSLASALTLATLERQGPVRVSALAAREGIAQPSMTQLLQRLEARGLVMRSADATDARATLVTITEAGVAALAERRAVSAHRLAALLEELPGTQAERLAAAVAGVLPALREHARRELVPA